METFKIILVVISAAFPIIWVVFLIKSTREAKKKRKNMIQYLAKKGYITSDEEFLK